MNQSDGIYAIVSFSRTPHKHGKLHATMYDEENIAHKFITRVNKNATKKGLV